jgi:hypothetical protein
MVNFFENPELVRHLRMEMRPKRMAIAAVVSISVCLLIWMSFTSTHDVDAFRALYATLAIGQAAILTLWCFSACSQAVANERVMKTFDFLRTTRLTSGELLAGMLFGVPVMAYFVTTLSFGVTLLAGMMAGYKVSAMVVAFAFTMVLAVVVSLAGLSMSMITEKPRIGAVLALFLLWPLMAVMLAASESVFPALQGVGIVPGLLPLFGINNGTMTGHVKFFGANAPTLMVTLVLYGTFAAWLVLVLVRNLKKEREDIQLLSRWQAIGFMVYLNLMMFGITDVERLLSRPLFLRNDAAAVAELLTNGFLALNYFVFYVVGITTLSTPERFKIWWRQGRRDVAAYFAEDGPPWTWIAIAAVCAMVLYAAEMTITPGIPTTQWHLPVWQMFVLLAYAVRDITFLQWCKLTKMKDAVAKGLAFVGLYYFASFALMATLHDNTQVWKRGMAFLTPAGVFDLGVHEIAVFGAMLQLVVAGSIAWLISRTFSSNAVSRG